MLTAASLLATFVDVKVPESGMTAALVLGGVLTLGLFARFVKNRSK